MRRLPACPSILGFLLAPALIACAGAPPPAPPRTTVVTLPAPVAAPRPAATPDGGDEGAAASLPPPVTLPEPAGCVLDGPWNPGEDAVELRLQSGGPVYAELIGVADARLHLAVGRAGEAGLEIEAGNAWLRARIDREAVALRPARAVAFQGFAVPLESARLGLQSVEPGFVSVVLPGVPGVEVTRGPLQERLRCEQVTAGQVAFDATAAAGDRGGDKAGLLRLGRPIPLSVEPGGAPVAALRAKDDEDAEVMIVGTSGSRTRVLWWREEALIFGWVPTADLRPKPAPGGEIGEALGGGGLGLSGVGEEKEKVTCPGELPLVVEVGGQRATVGRTRAGAVIEILERSQPYARVSVSLWPVVLHERAQLLVRAADLAGCARNKGK